MSISSPRRIFRRSTPSGSPRLLRAALWLGLPCGLLVTGVALFPAVSAFLTERRPLPADVTLTADAAQVAVVDGDTLRLRDTVIRLAGVAAPARGTGCGLASGASLDCGSRASVILAGLVSHAPTECHLDGRDASGRPLGLCRSGGVEINRAVVESGWATAEPDQPALDVAEHAAQAQRRGLWAMGTSRP